MRLSFHRLILAVVVVVALSLSACSATTNESVECVVGDTGECILTTGNDDDVAAAVPTAGAAESSSEEDVVPATDKNCPDRPHIIRCAGAYLDSNKNGKLDRVELDAAIGRLPWYGRGIVQILGSTDKMMKKCDVDKDDAISMDYDMIHNHETCLASCFKRRAFKQAFFADCAL